MAETLTEARAKLQRARSTIRTLKERGQRTAQLTTHAAMTGAGGSLAAVADRHLPRVAGVQTKLVVGLSLTAVGVTELAGDWSDEILALGSGMLAVSAYQMTREALAAPS